MILAFLAFSFSFPQRKVHANCQFVCKGNAILLICMIGTVNLDNPDECAWWFGHGPLFAGASTSLGLLAEYMTRTTLS